MNNCVSLPDRALEHAEHAELADERIVDDLEHVGDHVRGFGSALEHDRLGIAAAALDEQRRVAFERAREQFLGEVEQFLDAGAGARRYEADRHQVAFAQALLEGVVQVLPGQAGFAFLQVAAHHRFVDLHDLVDDALVRRRRRPRRRFRRSGRRSSRPRLRHSLAGRLIGRHSGPKLPRAVRRSARASLPGSASILLTTITRHRLRAWATSIMRRVPYSMPCPALTTTQTVSTAENADRVGPRKSGKPGRVDQVDVDAAVVDRRDGGVERVLPRLFHRVEVGHRAAALDAACRLDRAAGMQQGFEKRGFAGAGVACQGHIADLRSAVRHNDLSLLGALRASWSAARKRGLRLRAGNRASVMANGPGGPGKPRLPPPAPGVKPFRRDGRAGA